VACRRGFPSRMALVEVSARLWISFSLSHQMRLAPSPLQQLLEGSGFQPPPAAFDCRLPAAPVQQLGERARSRFQFRGG